MKIDLSKDTKPVLNPRQADLHDKTNQGPPPAKKFQFKSVKSVKTPESSFLSLDPKSDPKSVTSNRNETAEFLGKHPPGNTSVTSVPPRFVVKLFSWNYLVKVVSRETFAEKMLRGRGGGGRPSSAKAGGCEVPTFRPASHKLVEDRARKGEGRDGITASSYGSSKRQLGAKPGNLVAAAFKPPVKNSLNVNNVQHSAGAPRSYSGPDGEPELYKNIDPKMVEMVENEIMDTGEPVEWDDIAGLEFAKATVKEIVVFPLLRPDIFTGLRGPPKVSNGYILVTLHCEPGLANWNSSEIDFQKPKDLRKVILECCESLKHDICIFRFN